MYPFWSPDSQQLGFFAESKLKTIHAAGGPPITLCEVPNGRGGAWGSQGTIVFTPTPNSPLMRVPAGGGTPEPASKLNVAQGENSHRWPTFLPDGKHFIYWSRNSRGAQEHLLYAGSLDSLEAKTLAPMLRNRIDRPLFIIDIAVPRDVEPAMNKLEGIFVYDIDDLQTVAASHMAERAREAGNAEALIAAEVERYHERQRTVNVAPGPLPDLGCLRMTIPRKT